jgi:hypothetical protein
MINHNTASSSTEAIGPHIAPIMAGIIMFDDSHCGA